MEMEPIGCPETLVINYDLSPRKNPEERSSQDCTSQNAADNKNVFVSLMRLVHSASRFTAKNYYFPRVSSLWAEIRLLVTVFCLHYIFTLIKEFIGTLLITSLHVLPFFLFLGLGGG
jgi:hypothetical protein